MSDNKQLHLGIVEDGGGNDAVAGWASAPIPRMRDTSLLAYRQIKEEGLLSRMRFVVYDHLFHHGPLTAVELSSQLKGPKEVSPSYHKRLSELERLGVVRTVDRRECSITGREAELWDVTSRLPAGLAYKPRSSPDKLQIRAALDELDTLLKDRDMSDNLLFVLQWLETRAVKRSK